MSHGPDTAMESATGVYWIPMPEGTVETTVRLGMSGTSEQGAWTNFLQNEPIENFEEVFDRNTREMGEGIGQKQGEKCLCR